MQGYNTVDEKYALSTLFYDYLILERSVKRCWRKGTLLYSIWRSGVESFAKRKKGNDTVRLTAESIVEYLQLEYLQWSDFNTGESIYRRGGWTGMECDRCHRFILSTASLVRIRDDEKFWYAQSVRSNSPALRLLFNFVILTNVRQENFLWEERYS